MQQPFFIAMSGYCADPIGTSDYYLTPHAA